MEKFKVLPSTETPEALRHSPILEDGVVWEMVSSSLVFLAFSFLWWRGWVKTFFMDWNNDWFLFGILAVSMVAGHAFLQQVCFLLCSPVFGTELKEFLPASSCFSFSSCWYMVHISSITFVIGSFRNPSILGQEEIGIWELSGEAQRGVFVPLKSQHISGSFFIHFL